MSKPNLDETFKQLQDLVDQFEQGKISLEESPQKYQQGLELAKLIKTRLNDIQTQIKTIQADHKQNEVGEE